MVSSIGTRVWRTFLNGRILVGPENRDDPICALLARNPQPDDPRFAGSPPAGFSVTIRAACEHGIKLDRSRFVGDRRDDIEAGRHAGCCTFLINNGQETEWFRSAWRWPDYMVTNLEEAARIIGAGDGLSRLEPSGVNAEKPSRPAPS